MIVISRSDTSGFSAHLHLRYPPTHSACPGELRSGEIAADSNVKALIRKVDAFVRTRDELAKLKRGRFASWRLAPASPAQRDVILGQAQMYQEYWLGGKLIRGDLVGRSPNEALDLSVETALTKGQASDIITRLKVRQLYASDFTPDASPDGTVSSRPQGAGSLHKDPAHTPFHEGAASTHPTDACDPDQPLHDSLAALAEAFPYVASRL